MPPGADPRSCYDVGRTRFFDGKYRLVGMLFSLRSAAFAERRDGLSTVFAEFYSSLMEVVDFPSCPQTIVARVAQELARLLIRERGRYQKVDPWQRDQMRLRKTLTGLKLNSKWVCEIATQ